MKLHEITDFYKREWNALPTSAKMALTAMVCIAAEGCMMHEIGMYQASHPGISKELWFGIVTIAVYFVPMWIAVKLMEKIWKSDEHE